MRHILGAFDSGSVVKTFVLTSAFVVVVVVDCSKAAGIHELRRFNLRHIVDSIISFN